MAARKAQRGSTGTAERNVRSGEKKVPGVGATNTKGSERQTTGSATSSVGPTYEQIARRAEEIWQQKGCPPDQDDLNWREAEAQLKSELGSA